MTQSDGAQAPVMREAGHNPGTHILRGCIVMKKFTAEKTFYLWGTDFGAIEIAENRRMLVSVHLVDEDDIFDYRAEAYMDGAALMGMTDEQYDEWLTDEDMDIGAVYDRCTMDSETFRDAIEDLTSDLNRAIDEWDGMSALEKAHKMGVL